MQVEVISKEPKAGVPAQRKPTKGLRGQPVQFFTSGALDIPPARCLIVWVLAVEMSLGMTSTQIAW